MNNLIVIKSATLFKVPSLLFTLILTCISFSSIAQWVQFGLDIDGVAANDKSGFSVSMPDNGTIAIGAPLNDSNGTNSGHVRVFHWNGNTWVQKGNNINGESAGDEFGFSVDMPDSQTLAVGGIKNDGIGTDAGHVRVFKWNGNTWTQKGSDIDGEAAINQFGYSVSMPDSNTVAIGGRLNSANGRYRGHVRVFKWNGSAWIKMGPDIDGEAPGDEFGYSVDMPDTLTLAVGAYGNDGNGFGSGHTRIFNWNGSRWVQKGTDIDGEAANDGSGFSVSMPDSNTVAIGAYANSGVAGSRSGHVRIYSWNGTRWNQKGSDIDGEQGNTWSGYSVSMPNANMVAIGAPRNSGGGGSVSSSGHVRIFNWSGSRWIQNGLDIDGEASWDSSGVSVCMPDTNTVAIGAIGNDGNGASSGHVRIYRFGTITSLKNIENEDNIALYPNPTKGQFNLETSNSIGEVIQISSISGKVLKEITISQNHEIIDLSGLANGLYFLKIGELSKKIIKYE